MADRKIDDRSDAMEGDLRELEDHIADAEKKLEARKGDADGAPEAAGASEDEQDRGKGNDPEAAHADETPPGDSQDGENT